MMPLVKATNHDLFFHLQSLTKADALSELVDLIAERRPIPDAAVIKEKILAREELMSTGIGLGIGVPHVRLDHLKHPLAAVGISRVGIADYGSLDDQPVRIICMILVPVGAHREYIRILSQIATRLKDDQVRDLIIESPTTLDAHQALFSAGK